MQFDERREGATTIYYSSDGGKTTHLAEYILRAFNTHVNSVRIFEKGTPVTENNLVQGFFCTTFFARSTLATEN